MSSSNLLPGVTESDIPGNRPEDDEWGEFHKWIDEVADKNGLVPGAFRYLISESLKESGLKD